MPLPCGWWGFHQTKSLPLTTCPVGAPLHDSCETRPPCRLHRCPILRGCPIVSSILLFHQHQNFNFALTWIMAHATLNHEERCQKYAGRSWWSPPRTSPHPRNGLRRWFICTSRGCPSRGPITGETATRQISVSTLGPLSRTVGRIPDHVFAGS